MMDVFFFFWKLLLLYLPAWGASMSHDLVGGCWFVPWSTSLFHDVTPSLSPPFVRVALSRLVFTEHRLSGERVRDETAEPRDR